jgi:Spy/CpxP family protein refolding chaperone
MKITKSSLITLLAITGTLSFQLPARAQTTNGNAAAKPAAGEGVNARRERLQQIAAELKLTDEQKGKIQAIVRDRMEKLRGLREDASLSQPEKMEKLKAAREEIAAEIKKLLTPEQFAKWKEKQGQLMGQGQGPRERLQEAIQELNLTEEQKEKLKGVYQDTLEKLRDLRQDANLSMQEKLEKLKAMRKEIEPDIKKTMDAAQYEKWQKSVDQWLEQLQKRFQGQKEN